MNNYISVLKKYAVFSGRASRGEYWTFILMNFVIVIILTVLDISLGLGLLSNIYSLAVLIPSLAVGVRRMHDSGRSGWWIILPVVNIIFLLMGSEPGPNRYGPNLKGETERPNLETVAPNSSGLAE